jgi:hypothetical protein
MDSFDFRRSRALSLSSASAGLVALDVTVGFCAMPKVATVWEVCRVGDYYPLTCKETLRRSEGTGKFAPMVDAVLKPGAAGKAFSVHDEYIKAFRIVLLARLLDEKFASLYRMGKIHGGVFLGKGQEALSAAVGLALRKGDIGAGRGRGCWE